MPSSTAAGRQPLMLFIPPIISTGKTLLNTERPVLGVKPEIADFFLLCQKPFLAENGRSPKRSSGQHHRTHCAFLLVLGDVGIFHDFIGKTAENIIFKLHLSFRSEILTQLVKTLKNMIYFKRMIHLERQYGSIGSLQLLPNKLHAIKAIKVGIS